VSTGEVSAYDRMVWPEGQVEGWLATGEHRRELTAWFGEAEYGLLQRLAFAAAAVDQDPERCVYFVPGLMGSQLSVARARPQPDNLLWLDPGDIQRGNLALLAVPGGPLLVSGPVLYSYLPLKFALQAAGYTVRCFAYDWRLGIVEMGAALAARLSSESAGEINLVAHSMGGLLARSALRSESGRRVRRLITLGTPHGGSFAPVQAVRGTYPLVRRLAQIDARHDAEALAREVFSSFHSLYQMLPRNLTPDLLNQRNWPPTGPQPNATLLDRVRLLELGGADRRITAIAGFGFQTADHLALVEGEFYYRYSFAGDGTVPTTRAVLGGCPSWYCNVAHMELTRSPAVHAALVALLADDAPRLSGTPPAVPGTPFSASDTELRRAFTDRIDWTRLDTQQRRAYLDSLNRAPPAAPTL
jgi:pimeloyl-ACP methyl ester carboxylesterase